MTAGRTSSNGLTCVLDVLLALFSRVSAGPTNEPSTDDSEGEIVDGTLEKGSTNVSVPDKRSTGLSVTPSSSGGKQLTNQVRKGLTVHSFPHLLPLPV